VPPFLRREKQQYRRRRHWPIVIILTTNIAINNIWPPRLCFLLPLMQSTMTME
jgi:hypothetical protein